MKKIITISSIAIILIFIGAGSLSFWDQYDGALKPIASVDIKTAINKEFILSTPVWNDLRFPASSLNPPGAVNDADVDANSGILLFDAGATEQIVGIAQMDHKWVSGTPISPHIHWSESTADTGSIVWVLSYKWAYINETFAASYTTDTLTVLADSTANKHRINGFSDMTFPAGGVSAILLFKIERVGGNAADTYGHDAKLLEFDIHYQLDRMGSKEETSR